MLGSIWGVEGDEPLGQEARRILESAAGNVALHLLRRRAEPDPERRRRVEAVMRLLDGTSQDASGLGLSAPVTVVALGTGTGAPADVATAPSACRCGPASGLPLLPWPASGRRLSPWPVWPSRVPTPIWCWTSPAGTPPPSYGWRTCGPR
ncbi:hypothetical protein [Nonomuraea angiospora]|uniref:hypothetical protein n=1 Tax=Nonomuraea angiospora TaxID=46172 RepID=UPI0029BAECEF|nr:hypothetical protein [Nonomuraea angiospora]MDX3104548.1 hypothetical protein [Nonomuraea angiospora]